MQPGLDLQALAAKIVNDAKGATDLLADNSQIRSTHLQDGSHAIHVGDHTLKPNTVFNQQLATKLGIYKPYYDRMAEEAPWLLDKNVNHWLRTSENRDKRRLVRCHETKARAYLSDRYRTLDNVDLANAILPKVADLDLKVKSTNVTETRMYVQAISERLKAEVRKGDLVHTGINISNNSEVGMGSINVEHLLWRCWCDNGCISMSVIRKAHIGRSHSNGNGKGIDLEVERYFKDETRQLDDAAFFSKVRDAIDYALSPEIFEQSVAMAQGAAEVRIAKPKEAVEVVTKQLKLTEGEGESLLANLIEGGDLSKWGMANAVTTLAHTSEDYDRAVNLERAGTQVMQMPKKAWQDTLAA